DWNCVSLDRPVCKALLLAALCAWPLATPASAPVAGGNGRGEGPPAVSREAAFDATFERVVGPTSMEATSAAYEGYLQRLQALLPAGDRVRETRFRSVYCGSHAWQDAKRGLAYS